MHLPSKPKIVVLGMMTKMPVAGVIWQTVHYLVGFQRLGFEVWYVEQHARTPSMFMETEQCDAATKAAAFIDGVMRRFDLGDRWCFHALHEEEGRCLGMSRSQLNDLFASAALIINLHGGTIPLPEHSATGRLIYLETDPVQLQIELHNNVQETIDFLEPHAVFFTFGENLGNPDCRLPVSERFEFKPTRQPVVMDFWNPPPCGPGETFTSIGNWQQQWREVWFKGERYSWSKHHEFLKIIELPKRTPQRFELALASYSAEEKTMLEGHGWAVRHAMDFSTDADAYRAYIAGSRGEFTVAKDQNVRLRSGWFSDRSATYLAAGRPVVTQDTGFSNILPTGAGLFGFATMDDALAAIEAINSDYARHSRAAAEIAREYFDSGIVLQPLLDHADLALRTGKPRLPRAPATFPPDLVLTPLSRRPIQLPHATIETVLAAELPVVAVAPDAAGRRVSIIVVTFNGLVFSKLSLGTLLANTRYPDYEVIIVDNASTDGTADCLRELAARNPHVRVIFNGQNAGFAAANNQGLAAASGDVFVLLNNDTMVAPGWLDRLIEPLTDAQIGAVGPVTNRIGNEAEIAVTYDTYREFLAVAEARARAHRGERLDIRTLCMFCLALRRDTWQRVGPLDERFEIGLLEDDDYALRLRAAGYQLICAEDTFVHHFGQASFGNLVPTGEYQRLLATNQRRFKEKWGVPWQPYARRRSPEYQQLVNRIRDMVRGVVPADATVLVVSKGDEELLRLDARKGWHFPQDEHGTYAGHYPADDAEAIAQVEALREKGADFLVLPAPAFWWLDRYLGLRRHLESRYRVAAFHPEICSILALREAERPRAFNFALSPRPQIACILGMHRSGTSLLTRLASLLGVSLGPEEHLMEPTKFNPKGFWEHKFIVDLNDELLAALGGSWRQPPHLPDGWERASELEPLRDKARALLEQDFAGVPVWGWKDPRTCLTLPFWRQLLPPIRCVLCLRNPADIAHSLEHTMPFESAVALWLRYTKDSLGYTGASPCLLVFYEDLMADCTAEMRRLAAFLEVPEMADRPEVQEAMHEFVDDNLRHHRTEPGDLLGDPRLSFPAKALQLALRAAAGAGSGAMSKALLDQFSQEAFKAHIEISALKLKK